MMVHTYEGPICGTGTRRTHDDHAGFGLGLGGMRRQDEDHVDDTMGPFEAMYKVSGACRIM